ncbi:5-(carboxyamino)imidazole ribonucleotide synthase [Citricoccus sp.]|uniref:5-(carboxyamino)imidazole ribonucleotide synthase n=1 Tax=Citricoccus sp. TaxID=1978372 RepID=UPI002618E6EF|nr:5-(carboxyamino)imidazole ribonucleotide synthase [Citricoccus sp.]HRO30911.1 5-(carboxyamino)imidazole ribonucleotide synthase [Citricoccus sp.]HRO92596.1 5-(carboxyamino)imidazole ribonucleotide synthase [Citricoccus sp.]
MSFPVIGVVGGGQLARMMAPAATALGVRLRVLAEGGDVSATTAAECVVGDYRDLETLRDFAASVDVVTFDHEHVPAEHLRALEAAGVNLQPGPDALQHAQDKLLMRQACDRLGLPNPAWAAVTTVDELIGFARRVEFPVVLKTPRGGYDGKGVRVVASVEDAEDCRDWFGLGFEALLVEDLVEFSRELSAQVARTPSGTTASYPVVESIQTDGICDVVTAPAPGIDPRTAQAAEEAAVTLAEGLGVTGMLAVELFETPGIGPGFMVNELAMRPHNSGHWTMDGAVTGQFEQHVRAVLDLPLGATDTLGAYTVMKNYLGGANEDLYSAFPAAMAAHPEAKIHAYGKSVRPGRKIGHVNVVAPLAEDLAAAREAAESAAAIIRDGHRAQNEPRTAAADDLQEQS